MSLSLFYSQHTEECLKQLKKKKKKQQHTDATSGITLNAFDEEVWVIPRLGQESGHGY